MKRLTQLAMAAITVASVSIGVYAASGAATENDAVVPPAATIGLIQAIQAAEKHASGRAVRAEYEATGTPRTWVYDVEVIAATKVFDVRVNATDGTVISSKEDMPDHDDDKDD